MWHRRCFPLWEGACGVTLEVILNSFRSYFSFVFTILQSRCTCHLPPVSTS